MSWTKEDTAKLREYQTAQMTVKEIAEKMHHPKQWIRDELKRMGYTPIETKPKPEKSEFIGKKISIPRKSYAKITPEIEQKVCELREQCFTTTQIAEKLSINSQQTVSNILKRNGYSTKRGEYHKLSLDGQAGTKEDTAVPTNTKEDKPMKAAKVNEEFDKAVDQMIAEAKEKEPVTSANDTSSEQDITPVIPTTNNTTEPPESQALSGIKMMIEIEAMLGEVFGRDAEIIDINANGDHCDIGFTYYGREYSLLFAEREEVPVYGKEVRK